MTGDERVEEFNLWMGPLEIDLYDMYDRLEALVGRSIWTHEYGVNRKELVYEARENTGENVVSYDEAAAIAISSIPEDKKVVVVALYSGE